MPIHSFNGGDTSQLLREISKLKLGGGGTGFRYIKHANCDLGNTESTILEKTSSALREILIINNTDSEIELFWDDGVNKIPIPDKLKTKYFDYTDGGLKLSALANVPSNIDIYVRSTKPIIEKVGNAIVIPEIEEDFYFIDYINGYQSIEILRIPIKPIFVTVIYFTGNYSITELPLTTSNTPDWANSRVIGDTVTEFQWTGFNIGKYHFLLPAGTFAPWDQYFNFNQLTLTQDPQKWMITLFT